MKMVARTEIEAENNAKLKNLHEQPQRLERLELIILAGAVILSIFVHGFFVMDGFGEPDAARMAVQAAGWHQMGRIPILSHPARVSPLYLHTLKAVLQFGCPLHQLANLMNWTSVIIGSLTLIPLYLLWRYLSTPRAAAIGCLLYSFTPAFWQANIYAMPHLPAFSFFVCALLLFAMSLQRSGVRFAALAVGSAILAALAVDLKADIILCFGAFLGVMVCLKSWNLRNFIVCLLIPVIALLSVLLYSSLIAPSLPRTVGEFAFTWSKRFPLSVNALLHRTNRMVPITAVGGCLFSAFILSTLYCIVRRTNLRLLFMTLLWGLPAIFFWSLRPLNARHLMAAYSVLTFLVAVVFVSLISKLRFALPIIVVFLLLNNFTTPEVKVRVRFQSGGPLIKSKNEMQQLVDAVRKAGREFTALPDQRKIIVGSWSIPYIVWQVLEEAVDFDIKWGNKTGAWAKNLEIRAQKKDNSSCIVRVMEIRKRPVKIPQPKGWRAWTCEPGIRLVKSPKN